MKLNTRFVEKTKKRIEQTIVPIMGSIYSNDGDTYPENFRPGHKTIEKVVSYYDYFATGVSVLATLAVKGDANALKLVRKIRENTDYYRESLYGRDIGDRKSWNVPLRRLLLHMALTYKRLNPILSSSERQWYVEFINEQVPIAIEHCAGFLPKETDLHIKPVNNHTAIFMQGIHYCGKVLERPEWVELTSDFAIRYLNSGHEDGYFEEHTNNDREGGPSLVYTVLTAGCLYDVLDGADNYVEKFTKAGDFFRGFLNHEYERIPIADERANHASQSVSYGLALHSLTAEGRYYIVDILNSIDFHSMTPEALAVIHHELDLMCCGDCEPPANIAGISSRISLPLGILRKNGYTAGISALRALNRDILPNSDYALDQQNICYLSHDRAGVVLTGIKSKNNPEYSTFRIGDDAYTTKTGELKMGEDWAEAKAFYNTFVGTIRWEIGEKAILRLSTDSDQTVTTSLPISDVKLIDSDTTYEVKILKGFSPYTTNNATDPVKCAVFKWRKELLIEFDAGKNKKNNLPKKEGER